MKGEKVNLPRDKLSIFKPLRRFVVKRKSHQIETENHQKKTQKILDADREKRHIKYRKQHLDTEYFLPH